MISSAELTSVIMAAAADMFLRACGSASTTSNLSVVAVTPKLASAKGSAACQTG